MLRLVLTTAQVSKTFVFEFEFNCQTTMLYYALRVIQIKSFASFVQKQLAIDHKDVT